MTGGSRKLVRWVGLALATLALAPAVGWMAEPPLGVGPGAGTVAVQAQEAPPARETPVRPGDLVELLTPAVVHREAKGRVLSFDGDTLVVATDTAGVRATDTAGTPAAGAAGTPAADAPGTGASARLPDDDVLRVAVDDVRRLRVHRGYGDARWRGVILGAPLGFAAASVLNEARQPVGRTLESWWQVGGAVAGAVLGWTIGRFVPVDVWVEVDP